MRSECFVDIILVDFEDSFTYNVAGELYEISRSLKVISYKEMSSDILSRSDPQVLVLGPGPGHPDEYSESIRDWVDVASERENIFLLGICLGHQLLLARRGFKLQRAARPIHGEGREVELFDGIKNEVQFYNSLFAVGCDPLVETIHNQDGEVLAARWPRHLTYQFHPESVGTNYPSLFFGPVRGFLYNRQDED